MWLVFTRNLLLYLGTRIRSDGGNDVAFDEATYHWQSGLLVFVAFK